MSSSNPTQQSRPSAPAAPAPVARPVAGFDAQRSNAFQRELDRLTRQDKGDDAEPAAHDPAGNKQRLDNQKDSFGQQQFGDERDQREDGQASLTASGFAAARAGKVAAMAQAAPELPPEHLNRIAAAIQELVVQGGNAHYHLQLPAGTATINGAVLGQDAGGRLTVQLLANAVLPPAAIQQLQQRLFEKLKNRNLRLGQISASQGETGQRVENRNPKR
jgi:hypothetical protein